MIVTFSEATAYVLLRSAAALPLRASQWRDDPRIVPAAAAVLADLCAVLFVLGYVRPSLRLAVGGWWTVLFLYSAGWVTWQARSQLSAIAEPDADAIDQSVFEALTSSALGLGNLLWYILGIAPPLIAGFFLFFDVMAPHEWPPFLPQ